MSKGKVLIADDDPNVLELLSLYLEKDDYEVLKALDGEEALRVTREAGPDLLILDVMMPKVDGWEVCRAVRQESFVPIIMLTAKGEDYDRILGLELGADDYVVKPFNPVEVVARVKAILRRVQREQNRAKVLDFPGLHIDVARHEVAVDGQPVALTPKEFDLLVFLAERPGWAYTREQILSNVWGYDFVGDGRTVDAHIKRLRQKLAVSGKELPWSIATVWGVGYKFDEHREAQGGGSESQH
ncbi:MAG: response regulator transcription factor [Firmicutes bacterium]|mgnify:FL=1|nr:response regulator transcription factor [Bacillota bacterium]